MALAKLKMDTTDARLAGVVVPEGAAWSNDVRADALSRVSQMGLPTKRDEYWKYTDPASLTAPVAPKASLFINDEGPLFDAVDRVRIVFVDGVFDADASDDLVAEGVETAQTCETLSLMGCDYLQGYHLSRPLAFVDFVTLVNTRK